MKTYSLYELNEFLRRVVALNFNESIWLIAEIGQISLSRGHYYLRLLEKEEDDIIAEMSGVIWSSDFRRIQRILGVDTEGVLMEGMEVRLKGRLDFHERYGLKLIIEEVDAAYTIGKLEIQKRKLITDLQAEQLLDRNKQLLSPSVWQRIAVISSETAAGWLDFKNHIETNIYSYEFDIQLFNTAMQGQFVEKEMLHQLERICLIKECFDCVVVIRGGGAKLDLTAFDTPSICRAVAHFPLPVLTGIGHEIDFTVLDMVSFMSLKTPTAVADFLIERNLQFESKVMEMSHFLQHYVQHRFHTEGSYLEKMERVLVFQSAYLLKNQMQNLDFVANELPNKVFQILKFENIKLQNAQKIIDLLGVEATLKRGFSITKQKGRVLTSLTQLDTTEIIETQLADGHFVSTVMNNEIINEER